MMGVNLRMLVVGVLMAGGVEAQDSFGQQQSGFGVQQPSGFGSQPPGGFGGQPQGGFGAQPPGGFGGQQPGSFGNQQPGGFGEQQPGGFGVQQPGGFGGQPQGGFGAQAPSGFGGQQPGSFGGQQPGGFGEQQPGGFGVQPPGGQAGFGGNGFNPGGGLSQQGGDPFAQLTQLERRDFGVPAISELHTGAMHGATPTSIPGGQVITTQGLFELVQSQQTPYLIFDALGGQEMLPGAIPAAQASQPGSFNDQLQQSFGQYLRQLTQGNSEIPLIFYCSSPECWMSYNAALRAINLGYRNVLWYRGGITAWKYANGPTVSAGQMGSGAMPSQFGR